MSAFLTTLFYTMEAATMIVEVFSLGQIILFLQGSDSLTLSDAYLYAMGLSLASLLFVCLSVCV